MTSDNNELGKRGIAVAGKQAAGALPRDGGVELPAPFELLRPLGSGAMARVFLARNRSLKRLVAIKVLRPELSADVTSRQRFEREAQAAARLSHEAVTTVYSTGRLADGTPFIEMEFIDGDNLAELLRSRGPFGVERARHMLVQLASALSAAHRENIVHRDVKPANVLVDARSGRACLTDFGVAAILGSGSEVVTRLTRDGERFGDPRYMSPEQLRGEEITGQSDIYSLGIVGYELLTGQGPFDGSEVSNMPAAHLRRPPTPITNLRADVPDWLSDLLRRCLAKRPAHRPRAGDLARLLERGAETAGEPPVQAAGGPLQSFLAELTQRKVYRSAAAYAAVAFVVLQAADLLLPALPNSEELYRLAVVLCLAGFPVVVALAWLFDWRDGRFVRTDSEALELARSASPAQRLAYKVVGLGISIALAVSVAAWLLAP